LSIKPLLLPLTLKPELLLLGKFDDGNEVLLPTGNEELELPGNPEKDEDELEFAENGALAALAENRELPEDNEELPAKGKPVWVFELSIPLSLLNGKLVFEEDLLSNPLLGLNPPLDFTGLVIAFIDDDAKGKPELFSLLLGANEVNDEFALLAAVPDADTN